LSFQSIATSYDLLSSPARLDGEIPALAAWLGTARRVLDLGCGLGEHIARLKSQHGFQVTGLDFDPGMIAEGRKRHPGLDLILGDLTLPPAGPWDALLCLGNSLSCLPQGTDWKKVFLNWRQFTHPGGKCRIQWVLPAASQDDNRVVRKKGSTLLIKTLVRDGDICHLTVSIYTEEPEGLTLESEHRQVLQCLEPKTLIDGLYIAGWREIHQLPLPSGTSNNTYLIEATNLGAT